MSNKKREAHPDKEGPSGKSSIDKAASNYELTTTKRYEASLEYRRDEGVGLKRCVSFYLSSNLLSVGIEEAEEILKISAPTYVPGMPSFVIGTFSLRGEMVPLVDLSRRLYSVPGCGSGVVLVVSAGGHRVGLAVEKMAAIIDIPLEDITPAGDGLISGRAVYKGKELSILDGSALVDVSGKEVTWKRN